uniref:Exocyst complex component EXO84 n=1 Tax=Blastobotrys adeninivorans TaxID=409370 RepID=A0A060T7X9_BLAAD
MDGQYLAPPGQQQQYLAPPNQQYGDYPPAQPYPPADPYAAPMEQGQSLRKHRQTLMPNQQRSKPNYGNLTVPGQGENSLPNVAQKDKDKIVSLVKKRLSSRPPARGRAQDGAIPALPSNAQNLISEYQPAPIDRLEQEKTRPPPMTADVFSRPHHAPADEAEVSLESKSYERHDVYDSAFPDRQRRPSAKSESSGRGDVLDQKRFLDKDFDAEAYISKYLGSATDVEIAAFADKLVAMQTQLAADKKEAMYSNYQTFLAVGSEIHNLGSQLEVLRRLLNDLHAVTSAMNEDASHAMIAAEAKNSSSTGAVPPGTPTLMVPGTDSLHAPHRANSTANRNSMMVLETMWAKELSSLFKAVDGAQKYLPAVPGRHVVKESGGWYQLNAATWKPLQAVHFFLLNDHLLVASKRRQSRRAGNDTLSVQPSRKLVAEQCFPLQDITLMDLNKVSRQQDPQSASQKQTTFGIRHGTMTFVYRCDKADAHVALMTEFKKAQQALKRGNGDVLGIPRHGSPAPKRVSSFEDGREKRASIDITGRTRSLREVDELVNELDVKIAYRQFPEAAQIISSKLEAVKETPTANTSSVEKLAAMSTTAAATQAITSSTDKGLAAQVLKMKLEQRRQELADVLLHEIAQGYLSRSQVQENVELLIRLQAGEAAKKTLFESRHELIRKRIKDVEFHGDIVNYITQVAIIHFRMMLSTAEIFSKCYSDAASSSSLVEWVKQQIEDYVMLFARQLFNVSPDSDVYKACAEVTKRESAQLADVGLDVTFMLSVIFDQASN